MSKKSPNMDPKPTRPIRPMTRKQSAIECSLENKTVFDNSLFHGVRRVYCSNISKNASIVGFHRSNNLNNVAIAFSNSTITIWKITGFPDMVLQQSISGFKGWIQHCIWSQCDQFLVVASDAYFYIYHKNQKSKLFERVTHFKPHNYPVSDLCWLKRDVHVNPAAIEKAFVEENQCPYTIVSCSYDGTICVWSMQDIVDGKYSELVDKNKGNVELEKGHWDASIMAYGVECAKCDKLWGVHQNMTATVEVNPKIGHSGKVTAVDCDPVGKRVVSGGIDNILLLWNVSENVVIKIYNRDGYHEAPILSVRWSYEKDIFASCAADGRVYLWSTKYNLPLVNYSGHNYAVDNLVFINSHKLLSSGRDSFIMVWDIKVGGVVDSEQTHGSTVLTKGPLHKIVPKMTGWINGLSCTPEGLDIVVITAFMKESLYLFSPKYTDPAWLKLPFHKKLINFFSRHIKKKAPKLKKEQQLIKDYDSKKHKKVAKDGSKIVDEPTWDEMNTKRNFIRVDSWSWNQHLVDYGESLSKKKRSVRRKASVLETLRRTVSRGNSMDYGVVSQRKVDEDSGRILGRGYSTVMDPEAADGPKLKKSVSAVWDPVLIDGSKDDDDDHFFSSRRISVDSDSERHMSNSRRRSVWALMEGMDELEVDGVAQGQSRGNPKIYVLEEDENENDDDDTSQVIEKEEEKKDESDVGNLRQNSFGGGDDDEDEVEFECGDDDDDDDDDEEEENGNENISGSASNEKEDHKLQSEEQENEDN